MTTYCQLSWKFAGFMKVANCDRLSTYSLCQFHGFLLYLPLCPTASFLRPSTSLLFKYPTTGSFRSSVAFHGGYFPKLPGKSENPRIILQPHPKKSFIIFSVFFIITYFNAIFMFKCLLVKLNCAIPVMSIKYATIKIK